MAASNKQVMHAMFKHMNALIMGHSKAAEKENAPPAYSNRDHGSCGTKRNRRKCTHCRKHVFHKPADCYKLKTNASKHWAGWKLVKDNRIWPDRDWGRRIIIEV